MIEPPRAQPAPLLRRARLASLAPLLGALLVAPAVAAAPPASPEITPPRALEALHADYPRDATGAVDVLLEITVASDGHVEAARVVEGAAPFTDAALAASNGWRFEPARRAGQPVRARIRAQIHFAPAVTPVPEAEAPPVAPPAAPARGRAPAAAALEVRVKGEPRAPGGTVMAKGEVRVLPGAFGDPFRAIEALPGVTPVFSGLPYFYVRGAPPGNVGYFLDDIKLPQLFHLLAGPAVVPPGLIERVELFPGGYPARYGRFAGGIVAGETRPPADELRAEGTLRLIDAGALVETPLPGGLGSALAGARYSYTAPVLSIFVPTFRLDYWDYQGRVTFNLSPHERLTVFAFGSHDYSAEQRSGVWIPVFASDFHRVDVRYEGDVGERTHVTQALTFGIDHSDASVPNPITDVTALADVRDTSLSARTRVVHRVTDAVLLRAGVDATLDSYVVDGLRGLPLEASLFPSRQELGVGFHADAVIDAGRGVELTPGLRLDLWGSGGATAISADPRFAIRLPLGSGVRLVDAVGLAHQAPGFALPVPGASLAQLHGGLQRSAQASAGVEADLPLAFTASATLFYDAFFNLSDPIGVGGASQPATVIPTLKLLGDRALGSGVGLELYLRRKLTERIGGFLAYTLSRSSRHAGEVSFAAQFDRTHVLQAAVSWDLGHGVRLGSRVVFYTGTPLSPFYPSAELASLGRERMPPYFREDVRLEKRWTIGRRGWLSLVFEAQNATLSREPSGVSCTSSGPSNLGCQVARFPPLFLPSIGLEGGLSVARGG
jgi:TonB family protein